MSSRGNLTVRRSIKGLDDFGVRVNWSQAAMEYDRSWDSPRRSSVRPSMARFRFVRPPEKVGQGWSILHMHSRCRTG